MKLKKLNWPLIVLVAALLSLAGCKSDSDLGTSGSIGGDTLVFDADGDGIPDNEDSCPDTVNDGVDVDADGIDDACDPEISNDQDFDNDTILNFADNCPRTPNTDQSNVDADLKGDACDTDADGDGVPDKQGSGDGVFTDLDPTLDGNDNCPLVANPDQADRDGDNVGDACDTDADNDGVDDKIDNGDGTFSVKDPLDASDPGDNCPLEPNPLQEDDDTDGVGDACETDGLTPVDADGDGVVTGDNCPTVANPTQSNIDGDSEGDACDTDQDNDTVDDKYPLTYLNIPVELGGDNCPSVANTDQLDSDGDNLGDACDAVDNALYECGISGEQFEPMLSSDPLIAATAEFDSSACLGSALLGDLTCDVENPANVVNLPLTDFATISNTSLLGFLIPSEVRLNVAATTGFAYPAANVIGVAFNESPELLQLDLLGGSIAVRTLLDGVVQEDSGGGINADLDLLGLSGLFDGNETTYLLLQTSKRFDTVQIYSSSILVSALEQIQVSAVCASKIEVLTP
ncbi:thrombospondin type 3 repeat-containing protein [Marinobacter profundi]|uniref:thrombospondin type 3 repeat-containing protein n=1 Tax=Marinobacter profundi TaxID=2666256 RepID=UPI00117C2770|nr:thrombospondin type 3 repeat-containing protein [Marinobacter profundi]